MPNVKRHPGTQARSIKTHRAILSAAERIFAKEGLSGARTDVIAAEAGVNKALLYYYFKSKESLFHAVVEDHFREFNEQALQILNRPGSPQKILLEYVSMHFDFISNKHRHASLYQQMMSGGKPLERLVHQYFLPRSQALGKLLERGMREGEFRTVDRFHTAISIVAMIVFYFSAARVVHLLGHSDAYSRANLRKRKEQVLDFIRRALFVNQKAGQL
ncbi:MAG TPA: TetR/AcrR family transcriptional regulator [Tepidisphaeraceae bacterium]|nr:TetR/AcrR family transcriptional regulator [Tepidisphaeraceae bacterium]